MKQLVLAGVDVGTVYVFWGGRKIGVLGSWFLVVGIGITCCRSGIVQI